jgi:hypothetical protein
MEEDVSYADARHLEARTATIDVHSHHSSTGERQEGGTYGQAMSARSDFSHSGSLQNPGQLLSISVSNDDLKPVNQLSGSMINEMLESDFADFVSVGSLDLELHMSDTGPADDSVGMMPAALEPPSPSLALTGSQMRFCSRALRESDLVCSSSCLSPRLLYSSHGAGASTPARTSQSQHPNQASSGCPCMAVTLSILEKVQSHNQVTSLASAEDSLYLLKRSIRQHQILNRCQSCKPTSRLMTFSILLVEKMVGVLKAIASRWELEMEASGPEKVASGCQCEACGTDTLLLGAYPIDTRRERRYLFGFLILLQAKSLGALQDHLVSVSKREDWESHRIALRPIALTLRDLQESLYEMIGFPT